MEKKKNFHPVWLIKEYRFVWLILILLNTKVLAVSKVLIFSLNLNYCNLYCVSAVYMFVFVYIHLRSISRSIYNLLYDDWNFSTSVLLAWSHSELFLLPICYCRPLHMCIETLNVSLVKKWLKNASAEEIAEAIDVPSSVGTALCMAAALRKDHEKGREWLSNSIVNSILVIFSSFFFHLLFGILSFFILFSCDYFYFANK